MSDPDSTVPVILFVDDEATAVKYFQRAIGSLAPVATAGSVEEGKRVLDLHADSLRVLVSDQRMPGAYGNELLEYAKQRYPDIVRILTTAYSEIEQTVEAVNQGHIYRYLQKPWEITALRMELKQALEVANLRRDHAQLLREKMMVRQNQVTATRIGALHACCATLLGSDGVALLETYLAAARCVGVCAPQPDWLAMDFADLASAEAHRSGALGRAAAAELEAMAGRCGAADAHNAMAVLVETLGESVQADGDGGALLVDPKSLTEYLESPSQAPVSVAHARWLACLLWLERGGLGLAVAPAEAGLRCTLSAPPTPMSVERLATWIEHFS